MSRINKTLYKAILLLLFTFYYNISEGQENEQKSIQSKVEI